MSSSAAERHFPDGFLWGAATAAHQVEGDNRWNDWWAAETAGFLPFASGEACRHYELFAQDFDLARSLGQNAHRLSIEWSRIEPEEGQWNEAALDHYRAVIEALRSRAIEPLVTLHHFTNPRWLASRGGWLATGTAERFAAYAERVAAALVPEVRWWLTINEPTVYAKYAMVNGRWPPFRKRRYLAALRVLRNMSRAHALTYDVIHRQRADAMVGLTHSGPFVQPRQPASLLDRAAATARNFVLNELPFHLLRQAGTGKFDFVGLNYYCRTLIHWSMRSGMLFGRDWLADDQGNARRYSDLGWEVYAPGFKQQLRAAARFGVPVVVTENGIATDDESLRLDYLREHLASLAEAVAEGVAVRGYFYWSLIDNFEWAEGTRPHFGLCRVDYASQRREPRPAARYYAEVCRSGRLPAANGSIAGVDGCGAAVDDGCRDRAAR